MSAELILFPGPIESMQRTADELGMRPVISSGRAIVLLEPKPAEPQPSNPMQEPRHEPAR